jgi:drug/metabolite transporter (DMT)-like permease
MKKSSPSAHRAWWALFLLSVIWGYNWVVMKVALRDAGTFDFAALRTALGALSLFAVLAWRRVPLAPRNIRGALLLGLLQTSAFIGLTVWAVEIGGAGRTAVLVYTMPFWVLVLAWPILGERLRGLQWPAVALAFAGLMSLLEPWRLHGELLSKALAVVAGVAWAASVIVAKKLRVRGGTELLSLTAWQMLLGALPLVAAAWLVPGAPIHWTGSFIAALLYNVIPANALAWLLWLYVLNKLSAGPASLGMLATPVLGVLAAWVQLGERPSAPEALGMLLIGVALALFSYYSMRQHRRLNAAMAQE